MTFALQIGFLEVTWTAVVDVLFVSGLLYQVYRLMQGTIAIRIFTGFLLFYLVYLTVKAARLELLTIVLGQFAGVGVLALIVLFQQEIRRFLFVLGTSTLPGYQRPVKMGRILHYVFKFLGANKGAEQWTDQQEVIDATKIMARHHIGALIVISRDSSLEELALSGAQRLDARISKRLLLAIFNKEAPLHDGAVIIHDDMIVTARCLLPISDRLSIPAHYGTRHRAAVGISESRDVFVIITSEETGYIAIAQSGQISPNVSAETLQSKLLEYLQKEEK